MTTQKQMMTTLSNDAKSMMCDVKVRKTSSGDYRWIVRNDRGVAVDNGFESSFADACDTVRATLRIIANREAARKIKLTHTTTRPDCGLGCGSANVHDVKHMAAMYAEVEMGREVEVTGAIVRDTEALAMCKATDSHDSFCLHLIATKAIDEAPVEKVWQVVDECDEADFNRNL